MTESDAIPGGERLIKKDWRLKQYLKDNEANLADPGVRRETFERCLWHEQGKPSIDAMVDAGFYHSGCGDTVICYSCMADLKQWNANDTPLVEHETHSRNCDFLKDRGLMNRYSLAYTNEQGNPVHQVTSQGYQTTSTQQKQQMIEQSGQTIPAQQKQLVTQPNDQTIPDKRKQQVSPKSGQTIPAKLKHQVTSQGDQTIPAQPDVTIATPTQPPGATASTAAQTGYSYDRSAYKDQKKREDSFGRDIWSSNPHERNQSKWLIQRGFFAPTGDFNVACCDCGFSVDGRIAADEITREHNSFSPRCTNL